MKKFITTLLSCLLLFSTAGCDRVEGLLQNNEEDTSKVTKETNISLLNDFEFSQEFDLLRLFGVLGKVEQNTDKTYVKTGASSAKVTVESNPYKDGAPYIYQAFELIKAGKDYRNFSKTIAITLDVYNASEQTARIGLQLAYKFGNGTRKNFTLPSGWSTIKFDVKREYIPQYTDENGVTAPFVEGLRLLFDRGEQDSVFYLDNLKLYNTKKSFAEITMSLEENEICSFDSEWQVELVEPSARIEMLLPSYAQDSEVTSTGTGSSIRIEAPAGTGAESWPGIALNTEMLKLVPWGEYPSTARLCFDMYAPTENGVQTIWLSGYTNGERYYVSDSIPVTAGKWTTFSVSVAEMNAQLNSDRYNFANTTSLVLRWLEHTGMPRCVYLDNFRMEF